MSRGKGGKALSQMNVNYPNPYGSNRKEST